MYVTPNDVHEYAAAIVELMDDEPRRFRLGKLGRARVEQELAWSHQQRAYLDVYRRLLGDGKRSRPDRGLRCAGSPGATSRLTARSWSTS